MGTHLNLIGAGAAYASPSLSQYHVYPVTVKTPLVSSNTLESAVNYFLNLMDNHHLNIQLMVLC